MEVVSKDKFALGNKTLIAEASTLGWTPGYWPEMVSVVNDVGEGFLFFRSAQIRYHNEFMGYCYTPKVGGISLAIYND